MHTRQTIMTALVFAVFVMGLWLGWAGFRHGLPFIDDVDEVTGWSMGRAFFDSSWPMFQPHYPPGLLFESSMAQKLQIAAGNPFYDVAGTTEIMRVISGLQYSITLLLIMWLAYRVVGLQNGEYSLLAAAIAGISWVLVPLVIIRAKQAIGDPPLWVFVIGSTAAGIEGWQRRSVRWIVFSLLLAMCATLFKWQGAAVLAIAGLACLRFWATDHKRALLYMAGYVVLVGAFAYWAVIVHGALESDTYLQGTHTIRPTLAIVLRNMQFQLTETGSPLVFGFLPVLALVLPLFIPKARQQFYVEFPLWMFPAVMICYDVILSFEGAPVFDRQYLAFNTLQSVMAGIGVVLLFQGAQQIAMRVWTGKALQTGRGIAYTIISTALAVGLLPPWISAFQTISSTNQYDLRPDTRNALAQWATTSITDGGLIATEGNLIAALQTLYGYKGPPLQYPFNYGTTVFPDGGRITQEMIDSGHIHYVVTAPGYQNNLITSPVTLLITYDSSQNNPPYRGESWSAYYIGTLPNLLPPSQAILFGRDIVLRGLGISTLTACPGTTINLRALWSAKSSPPLNYSFYLHLFSPGLGEKDANPSSVALVSAARPTTSWTKADELLIGAPFTAKIPPEMVPGQYQWWLGVYEPLSGQRLNLPDGTDHVVVSTISIVPCRASAFF